MILWFLAVEKKSNYFEGTWFDNYFDHPKFIQRAGAVIKASLEILAIGIGVKSGIAQVCIKPHLLFQFAL